MWPFPSYPFLLQRPRPEIDEVVEESVPMLEEQKCRAMSLAGDMDIC